MTLWQPSPDGPRVERTGPFRPLESVDVEESLQGFTAEELAAATRKVLSELTHRRCACGRRRLCSDGPGPCEAVERDFER